MSNNLLEAKGLYKVFKQGIAGRVHAVSDASIVVGKGERVFVHGPSGAGKSTFLYLLGGLNKPTKGKVLLRGKDIYRASSRARSRIRNTDFGFVFQFYYLLPELTVLENVMLPAIIKGGKTAPVIKKNAAELLDGMGLSGRINFLPRQLSGGESQRVAIARALINSPEILFCDEPT
ncbi:MAG: ABC transporter ATP-binding protein, partial [Candidatus Omnitrophica bacterium]|nr:ABC transporter ATP-binding protein [Candidatus Omnitrophota bacterium]